MKPRSTVCTSKDKSQVGAGLSLTLLSYRNTLLSYRTALKLPRGRSTIEPEAFNTVGQSNKLQSTNTEPVYVDLVPT